MDAPVNIFSKPWLNALVEYGNAKFGMILFTYRLAELLRDEKIYVYSVHPGAVRTDLMDQFSGVIGLVWTIGVNIYTKVN